MGLMKNVDHGNDLDYSKDRNLIFEHIILDVSSCARMLKISNKALYALVNCNAIPHKKISQRTIRFIKADILDWIRKEQ